MSRREHCADSGAKCSRGRAGKDPKGWQELGGLLCTERGTSVQGEEEVSGKGEDVHLSKGT